MLIRHYYNLRIYPTKEQEKQLSKQFGCCRFVYNYFLAYRRGAYELKQEKIYYFETSKLLTQLKQQEEYSWLREVESTSLQQSLRDLDAAFNNFFSGKQGYPKFKKRGNKESYRYTRVIFRDNRLWFPKIGYVKIKLHKDLSEYKCKSVTIIKKPSGKYFASILCEKAIEKSVKQLDKENSIGLDYSSTNFYIDSEGNLANYSKYYYQSQAKLAKEQRKLDKMKQGSNNWNKQRIKVARIHEKIYNRRHDFQHNLSHELATKYDYICIEDLKLSEYIENQDIHLAKSTFDNSYYTFVQMLYYKLEERGKKLIKVDRYYPSSQLCSCCGYRYKELTLNERIWTCPQCHTVHNRDINAARNILKEGLRLVT